MVTRTIKLAPLFAVILGTSVIGCTKAVTLNPASKDAKLKQAPAAPAVEGPVVGVWTSNTLAASPYLTNNAITSYEIDFNSNGTLKLTVHCVTGEGAEDSPQSAQGNYSLQSDPNLEGDTRINVVPASGHAAASTQGGCEAKIQAGLFSYSFANPNQLVIDSFVDGAKKLVLDRANIDPMTQSDDGSYGQSASQNR